MKTFSKEIREDVLVAQNGFCGAKDCYNKAKDAHHKFPNTKVNQRLYPLFLQSIFNCIFLCENCHKMYSNHKIPESMVMVYEKYLKKISHNA